MSERDRRFTDWGDPGSVHVTRPIERSGDDAATFLQRRVVGDWGDVPPEDADANDAALVYGDRVLSAYATAKDETIWIITESDRSVTTLLLPEDY